MHQFSGKLILIMLAVSFLLGLLVVGLHPNYSREANVKSNENYYPSVQVAPE